MDKGFIFKLSKKYYDNAIISYKNDENIKELEDILFKISSLNKRA